ncbi:MAG: hypothetical protein PVH84_09330 [Candidatus Aminicenantes bacterium]
MSQFQTKSLVSLAILCMGIAVLSPMVFAQEEKVEFRFVGNAIGMSGPVTGKTGRLTMTIDHWTTDLETKKLYETLVDGGSEALLKAMRERTVGYVAYTGTLRWPLNIARMFKLEDGRILVRLVTNRPILWWEIAAATPRSRDYEFGYIEFTLDEEQNKGEGYLIHTAKIDLTPEGKVSIETLGTNPHRLQNVKQTAPKK